ncbi:MAG: 50S ribosomal protein L5 [bacterium]|nr:50S ribosomal protein L5 [bacterium]
MLKQHYQDKVVGELTQEFELKNRMAIPAIKKVVVNMGIGTARDSREEQEKIVQEIALITGQKPSLRQAKKAIAGFGIRAGQTVGVAVTLRRGKMYDFLQKLFNIVLPRIRDFRGVPRKSFDQNGNYTLGLSEHTVFPEIDLGKISKVRSLEVTIVTSTNNIEQAAKLLEKMGMPFEKEVNS